MRLKLRKLAQAVGLSCFVALFFLTILGNLGVTVDRGTLPEIRRVSNKFPTSWQERAPRSILAEEPSSGENFVIVKPDVVVNDSITEPTSTAATVGLDDVFISVKTTKMFHESRLDVIIKTWFKLAPKQTYFFTDAEDPVFQKKTGGRMINTKCQPSHNRKALCCKMSVEFDTFLDSGKKWFCHFDDDNYVNVPKLVQLLARYDPQENVYLGKPSIPAPLEIPTTSGNPNNAGKESSSKISFWFATGGAGFCISRSLAMKMMPVASGGKFISIGDKIRLPDDVTMGYIIEHLLGQQLTVIDGFHSHLEPMKSISSESLGDQITFSYSKYWFEANTLPIEGFDMEVDPTRFLSLHCILFPKMPMCHGMKRKGRKVEYNKKA